MNNPKTDIYFLVFASIILFASFIFFIIIFFSYYRKRQRNNFQEKEELKTSETIMENDPIKDGEKV